MARTFTPLSFVFFKFMFSETLASASQACASTGSTSCVASWTAAEADVVQALELLQHRSSLSAKPGEKDSKQVESSKPVTDSDFNLHDVKRPEPDALIQHEDARGEVQREVARSDIAQSEEAQGEIALENDDEEAELSAHHPLWEDTIVFYRDGFCQRSDNAEPCLYRVRPGTLVLDWLNYPSEELHTENEGRQLSTDYGFRLDSEYPPAWFVRLFATALPDAAQGEEWSVDARKSSILATHGSGNRVICNEKGFTAIQRLKDDNQMGIFIRRLMALMNLVLPDGNSLNEFAKLQFEEDRSFARLVHDLEEAALNGAPLIHGKDHFDGVKPVD